ncbi:MAG: hypothetical protein MJZ06_06740 [Bacteroidaceae bacterium]|nr:hypothetical protein [Bacteroidaceae bacterium]
MKTFVGYRPEVRTVADGQEGMQIKLQTRNVLPEVVVMDKRLWEKDLKYFKRMFLGEDRWGRNALIMNEEVLSFDNEENNGKMCFRASASEPLIIDLPLLGYELHVDLVNFTAINDNETQCNILGYFHYSRQPGMTCTSTMAISGCSAMQAWFCSFVLW